MRILLVSALVVSSVALAGDAKKKDRWERIEMNNAEEHKQVTRLCGKEIPDTIDHASFGDDIYRVVGPEQCYHMLEALRIECGLKDSYKESAVAKIKKMVCRYGGPLTAKQKETAISQRKQDLKILKDGTFEWIQHYDADTEFKEFTIGDSLTTDIMKFLDKEL